MIQNELDDSKYSNLLCDLQRNAHKGFMNLSKIFAFKSTI